MRKIIEIFKNTLFHACNITKITCQIELFELIRTSNKNCKLVILTILVVPVLKRNRSETEDRFIRILNKRSTCLTSAGYGFNDVGD